MDLQARFKSVQKSLATTLQKNRELREEIERLKARDAFFVKDRQDQMQTIGKLNMELQKLRHSIDYMFSSKTVRQSRVGKE